MAFTNDVFPVTVITLKVYCDDDKMEDKHSIVKGGTGEGGRGAAALARLPLCWRNVTGASFSLTYSGSLTDQERRSGKLSKPNKLALSKKPWRQGEVERRQPQTSLSL